MDQVVNAEIVPYPNTALARATSMEATIAAAVEAQSRAMVQARYALAIRNPRDMDVVRQKLLKECQRPGFADVARYAKKQGRVEDENGNWVDNYITGPSIRFAEAAVRFFGNVLSEESVIHDDDERRVMRVSATDLEANLSYFADVVVLKQVERSNAKGREIISSRKNSYDKMTYLVKATDDETQQRQGSLISKALRKQVLRMLPRDIVDECMDTVVAVQASKDKANPDAQRNKIFDAFASMGVSAADIKEYIGHDIGQEDLPLLRAILQTLKQGEAKWSEMMAEKRATASDGVPAAAPLAEKLKAKAEKLDKKQGEPTKAEPTLASPEQLLIWQSHLQEPTDMDALTTAWDRVRAQPMTKAQLDDLSRLYMAQSAALRGQRT